jgi:hypothetical protein
MQSARVARPHHPPAPKPRGEARGPIRRYIARIRGGEAAQAIDASSFLVAALLYAERIADSDADIVDVVVTDAETGVSACFTLPFAAS